MSRRVQARTIAPMLGVTARTVVALASQGRLPTAAKIGHVWTFDLKAIEAFIARQEQQTRDAAWPKKTLVVLPVQLTNIVSYQWCAAFGRFGI